MLPGSWYMGPWSLGSVGGGGVEVLARGVVSAGEIEDSFILGLTEPDEELCVHVWMPYVGQRLVLPIGNVQ